MIEKAFSIQSYRYAREVISAIRFSGLYYLDSWFKDLLLEGRRQPELASYISSLFDLYREELNAL